MIFLEDRQQVRESSLKEGLAAVAKDLFAYLGKTFPVCCLSDEFHYFPQIVPPRGDWPGWDDFTPDSISETVARLSAAERALGLISQETRDAEISADAETLRRTARALREQLEEVRFHETQPTFYLTIMCTGLASALGDTDAEAWRIRTKAIPYFLKQAQEVLIDMPALFRDLGVEMVADVMAWLGSLERERKNELAPVLSALGRFADFLKSARTREDFLLPPEVVERIVREHLGCGVGLDDVRDTLMEEIGDMRRIVEEMDETLFPTGRREALRRAPIPEVAAAGRRETLWKPSIPEVAGAGGGKVNGEMPLPAGPADDLTSVYRKEAAYLLGHCLARGIVPADLHEKSPLEVSPLPPYLRAIRAASAYSFTPANPPKGTFYIVPPEGPWNDNREELAEYRMLTAHETYPGHHLLDTWRWHFVSPLRRPLENPLFYEGWACFAEELMRETGYFFGPADAFLLAKRRYRRAVRGLVDLDLQTGKLTIGAAAQRLVEAGFPAEAAASVVPKYALRPGYQVCYTFGVRRFVDLYRRYGKGDPQGFIREALSGGEIGFDLLEEKLRGRCGQC